MQGLFCIGFTGFIFKGKSLTGFTALFSANSFKDNDQIVLNWFLN